MNKRLERWMDGEREGRINDEGEVLPSIASYTEGGKEGGRDE